MKFKKYASIENSYREKEVDYIISCGLAKKDIEWVVTEKIDGSNFSFISDGKEVKVAKRSGIIEENENFYDADFMLEQYKQNVFELTKYIMEKYDAEWVQIFGEHFGGLYNGETEKGFTKIQNRVHYCPFTDFIVFDIYYKKTLGLHHFTKAINWDDVKELAKKFNFKAVLELFRGTFDECLSYSNTFTTKIPEMYGLLTIENNIAEGVVIKPVEPLMFGNGKRVILKNKNDKFKEKGRVKRTKKEINLTPEEEKWVDEISKYFEENRIQSVLSKGEVKLDWKQFGKLVGLFFKDALDDFVKDNPQYQELDKKERKVIQKNANNRASEFIREFMKKHF